MRFQEATFWTNCIMWGCQTTSWPVKGKTLEVDWFVQRVVNSTSVGKISLFVVSLQLIQRKGGKTFESLRNKGPISNRNRTRWKLWTWTTLPYRCWDALECIFCSACCARFVQITFLEWLCQFWQGWKLGKEKKAWCSVSWGSDFEGFGRALFEGKKKLLHVNSKKKKKEDNSRSLTFNKFLLFRFLFPYCPLLSQLWLCQNAGAHLPLHLHSARGCFRCVFLPLGWGECSTNGVSSEVEHSIGVQARLAQTCSHFQGIPGRISCRRPTFSAKGMNPYSIGKDGNKKIK